MRETTISENLAEFFQSGWTEVLSALLTPVLAVFAAIIAYQQWRTSRANVREKLFDRRWEVFRETQRFLSVIGMENAVPDDEYWKFTDTCQRSRFLFDKSIHDYLLSVRRRAGNLEANRKMVEAHLADPNRSQWIEIQYKEFGWLTDQLEIIFDRFEPYMSFDK